MMFATCSQMVAHTETYKKGEEGGTISIQVVECSLYFFLKTEIFHNQVFKKCTYLRSTVANTPTLELYLATNLTSVT